MISKSNNNFSGIAIIVPMYNEEVVAKRSVDTLLPYIRKIKVRSTLIVINDGSTDNTLKILKKLKKGYKREFHLVTYNKNKGYGGALQEGIKKAYKLKFKYIIVYDSDLTNHPDHITEFSKKYNEDWDCIKGSRFISGGKMENVPFRRSVFSYSGNFVASLLFGMGIKDCTNGLRMVKTELLNNIKYKENGFPIIVEELYNLKRMSATCTEIPNILSSRKDSETTFTYTPEMLITYFKYALKAFMIR